MQFLQIASAFALAGFTTAFPAEPRAFPAPTKDGFPNPNPSQLAIIEEKADGQISNFPPPPSLQPSSLTAFQLIAFNENFEVAFFSSLIHNITEGGKYNVDASKQELLDVLKTVKAQEELHSISALQVLEHFGAFAPQPCVYKFPTTDIKSAIALAVTFTDVVMGTLGDAQNLFATNGDAGPIRQVASIIGQEGEQTGWYRSLLGLKPSEKPFLTASIAPFAFSALQNFVVECPFDQTDRSLIDIPILPTINVLSGDGGANVAPKDQVLAFSADLKDAPDGWDQYKESGGEGLFVTYFTGQNLPVSEPVIDAEFHGTVINFKANFPFEENVAFGFTLAALTTTDNYSNFDDVANTTLAAPGLIQVGDKL